MTPSKKSGKSTKPKMPDGVFDRLVLQNVRCFRDVVIPLDEHVTVIIGENGSGKSTIVESLASLADRESKGIFEDFPSRSGTNKGEIALYQVGGAIPAAYWHSAAKSSEYRELQRDQFLFAYGRYRRVFTGKERAPGEYLGSPGALLDQLAGHAYQRRTVTVHRPDNNLLRDIGGYLVALGFGRQSDPRLQQVWDELNRVLPQIDPGLGALQMIQTERGPEPRLVRHGVALELAKLSDGYQSLLVIIFDLALRYRYLFDLENPLEGRAIVAIDEVDLHLHPRWQRKVIAQLNDLFPNTQFVLTTHSAIVAQDAIDAKRKVIVLQEHEDSIVPRALGRRLLAQLQGAEVGSVLLENRLFDVESRYSVEFEDIERQIDQLQERVSSGVATDQEMTELSAKLAKLEELVAKEDERRADSSTVAQMVKLETAFVKDLVAELRKARS